MRLPSAGNSRLRGTKEDEAITKRKVRCTLDAMYDQQLRCSSARRHEEVFQPEFTDPGGVWLFVRGLLSSSSK